MDGSEPPESDPDGPAKLLQCTPEGVIVFTGCASGRVHVTVNVLDHAPSSEARAAATWEVEVEEDATIAGPLYLRPTAGYSNPELVYEPAVPGLHRVLVQARGRTANYDLALSDSGEEYAISIWPVDQPAERLELRDDGLDI
ncbi:hypothetical protein OG474_30260 [Kribbella sp. NBC_01505]|uniref:hypothetical protein n=1 Tax=Kribbella sp. NBC_01505 TaxID=2903580 RepID=UPI0038658FD2